MTIRLLMLAASALLITSCDTEDESADVPSSEAESSVATVNDEEAIRAQIARWENLIEAKDAAAIAGLYTEDGAVMPPNATIGEGAAAIEQTWAAMLQTPGFDLEIVPTLIEVSSSADMALDRGTYRLAVSPEGTEMTDTGKYVVVWRKVDGEWKAAADIFNSDLSAGAE